MTTCDKCDRDDRDERDIRDDRDGSDLSVDSDFSAVSWSHGLMVRRFPRSLRSLGMTL